MIPHRRCARRSGIDLSRHGNSDGGVAVYWVEIDRGHGVDLDVRPGYDSGDVHFVRGELYLLDGEHLLVEWIMAGDMPIVRLRPVG